VKVTMLLADMAQAVAGKLYVLGGGWSMIGPGATPSALAIKIEIPWDEANRQHQLLIELVDLDGRPVEVGGKPVEVRGQFEAGRPAGLAAGTPLDAVLAINLPPIPLAPGHRYVWRLSINGSSREDWQAAFTVRPGSPPAGSG
jgi:hypothetical protein